MVHLVDVAGFSESGVRIQAVVCPTLSLGLDVLLALFGLISL
jgi:hypothetical protein